MPETEELSVEVRKLIIQQEIETHAALKYRLIVRARVTKAIKGEQSVIDQITRDLEKTELALDQFGLLLVELERES